VRYRKRPVEIEAHRFDPDFDSAEIAELADWCGGRIGGHDAPAIFIQTTEGTMRADIGDWIIRGVAGEFYPCKPGIFDATYEPVIGTDDDESSRESSATP
jgi:hypothetical protein